MKLLTEKRSRFMS